MPYDPRTRGYYSAVTLPDFTTTTNVHAEAATWSVGNYGTKRLLFSAADNNLLVVINGSFDGGVTYPIEVVAEFAVNAAATVIQTITDLFTDLQITADPAVNGAHGTLSMQVVGWSRG